MEATSASKARDVVLAIAALLLVVAAIAGAAWILWRALSGLESDVAAALLTVSATALISVFSLIFSRRSDRNRELELARRERQVPIHEEFMDFWFQTLMADKLGKKPPTEPEIIAFFVDFTRKITLWGSDSILKAYSTFREVGMRADPVQDSVKMLFAFEDLLFAIRKDLGHSNAGLSRGDLLRPFVTDIDDYLAATAEASPLE